ncbi:MAG: LexA family transcriptional regulator [Clostridia bacterium]|nr:LexA family transcriptional regulator [Clostridia bacterium]MBR6646811.1 LexA family transcriptional regulator [Clostridia bacterium]
MANQSIGERIKNMRKNKDLSLQKIAEYLDVNRSSIMRWERGETSKIKLPMVEKLASLFDTSPQYLLTGSEREKEKENWYEENVKEVGEECSLPVIGQVCAGNGLFAEDNILRYEFADSRYNRKDYFYLQVSGDSMSPKLDDGDLILVRKQSSIDSGAVGVFLIDGCDGVVKKVKYDKNYIELHSFNPYYPVRRFEGSEVQRISVVGKVIESKRVW